MFARNSEGLCGFMDDDDTNDLTGPNGEQYNDTIQFAESCKYHLQSLVSALEGLTLEDGGRGGGGGGGGQKVSLHVAFCACYFPADE